MSTAPNKPGAPWTVLRLLDWSKEFFADAGIDSPRLDAELLLAHTLGIDRVRLYMQYDQPLVPEELATYREFVKRRANREPVAYLTGTRGFWTLDLATDRRALVPRPDTEVLVEEALARISEGGTPRVLDIGTGTGAVALAIKSERPGARVVATDIDADALALAGENASNLGLDVELVQSDLFEALGDATFDAIVSNPPYVADTAEVDPEVRLEPAHALFAGPDGLSVIKRLVAQSLIHLHEGGWLLVEHGFDQGEAVRGLLAQAGYADVSTRQDYGRRDRVSAGRR